MPFVQAKDGNEIFVRDSGQGTPVVLIHGWPLSGDSWDAQINGLGERGFRVIAYDRRGFGRSGQSWGGYDYDSLASDLNDVLEALEVRGATLVGFSMGGGEVVRYLSRYGTGRVNKAVLVSAVTPYLLKTDDNPEGVDAKVFEDIEKQIREDRFAFFKSFSEKFYGRTMVKHTVSEGVLEWFQAMAMTGSLRSILATAKSWSTTDFRADMKGISIPVLVIHGTGDGTVPFDASGKRSAKILPNATLIEYDGEPHGLTVTSADRVTDDIATFVGGGVREPVSSPALA